MKLLAKILLCTSFTLALTGCDPFEGMLSVKKAFTVISIEKNPGCNGETGFDCEQKVNVAIPVGDHSAKMDFVGKDQLKITVKVNGKKKTINMDLPKNNIPSENGEFLIPAADLGQAFSAQGGIATNKRDSEKFRGYEGCTYTRYETVCNVVNNQTVCHEVPRQVQGQQYVEYFDRITQQNINVNFVGTELLAAFNGQRNFSERIYTYRDRCF